jgi:hypothetical protein
VVFEMTAAFAEHASTILLGRQDFFGKFRVEVNERETTFTLKRY